MRRIRQACFPIGRVPAMIPCPPSLLPNPGLYIVTEVRFRYRPGTFCAFADPTGFPRNVTTSVLTDHNAATHPSSAGQIPAAASPPPRYLPLPRSEAHLPPAPHMDTDTNKAYLPHPVSPPFAA